MMSEAKEFPSQWAEAVLPDAAEIIMGQSPPSSVVNENGEGIVFFQGKAEFGKIHPAARKYCTAPKKTAEKDDILLSVRAPVGPTNIATQTTAIGRGLSAIRAFSSIDYKFILYFFRNIEPWLSEQGTGTTFKAISGAFIRELPIPLPPLAEQREIARQLDDLLAQVDTLKTRLDGIPAILKRFRQSTLAAAVSGKLTEEWRGEHGNVKWDECRLQDVCLSISDGDHQAPPRVEKGIPFLVISNVSSGKIKFDEVSRWVPAEYFESLKPIRKAKKNDLLYTVTGSFGIPVIVDTDKKFCFQRHIAIIKPNHKAVNFKFLHVALGSFGAIKQAESVATGTAQKTVPLRGLRNFSFEFPPLDEQAQIVRRVEELFVFADQIEQRVKNAQARVDKLTQSILAKAFRGELTADWRAANPALITGENSAEVLLERIKEERKKLGSRKKNRKRKG